MHAHVHTHAWRQPSREHLCAARDTRDRIRFFYVAGYITPTLRLPLRRTLQIIKALISLISHTFHIPGADSVYNILHFMENKG